MWAALEILKIYHPHNLVSLRYPKLVVSSRPILFKAPLTARRPSRVCGPYRAIDSRREQLGVSFAGPQPFHHNVELHFESFATLKVMTLPRTPALGWGQPAMR
jgi:hypothetical protein